MNYFLYEPHSHFSSLTLSALLMGNWVMENRIFIYFGQEGREAKRLLASRALSGWDDVYVQPTNPAFVLGAVFTGDVVDKMVLHAYGEHLSDMGTMHLTLTFNISYLTSCNPLLS